ncbi:uncharacterized protein LOC106151426 [Lingula anatina]|uniref:Uncharacterized protein LOC106151426 n=1 Tax=Lingula anatina TaxID=7574 RepID=A0A1S3H4S3_LINAN|nr:uncharacterized protein LOC106151426 [Lingula anatina]|eukprot:XP_013380134.1 uncharacterized protein LOC106151426 [Lingula anatina]
MKKAYVGDYCCVPGCTNSRGKCNREGQAISFYQFPKDVSRKHNWLCHIPVEKDFTPTTSTRICSVHFAGGRKNDDPTHPSYSPTIFPNSSSKPRTTNNSLSANRSYNQKPKHIFRKRSSTGRQAAGRPKVARLLDCLNEAGDHDYYTTNKQQNLTKIQQLEKEVTELKEQISDLKGKFLRLENIKDDDRKFQFWTNLPNFLVFSSLCDYLKTRTDSNNLCYWNGEATNTTGMTSKKGPTRKFTFEEEFFMVLVKLKTGKFNEDIAQTFDISTGHFSKIFTTWINFLSNELKTLFEMKYSTEEQPNCFQSFDNLKIILDCTELLLQKSSSLDSRKSTFSNYKHHDTVKFLVGISPNLAVNFVSSAWGGRASDKHITLNSEPLLHGLKRGDLVMSDRGFTVSDELEFQGVKIVMPDFKGRERVQFTNAESNRSNKISHARIHVERIIQRIKTFHLLEQIVKLNMFDLFEQIFVVCAYLTNFQLPVIKK